MGFITKALAGPGQQNPTSEGENVANHAGQYYDAVSGKLIDSTGNSPAAKMYAAQLAASLQPQFDRQTQNLTAKESALGIGNSGAAKADYSNLTADQSGILAGAIAPLYQSAIGMYGNLLGAKAGAQSSGYGNQYSQTSSENYNAALKQQEMAMQALQDAGMAMGGA